MIVFAFIICFLAGFIVGAICFAKSDISDPQVIKGNPPYKHGSCKKFDDGGFEKELLKSITMTPPQSLEKFGNELRRLVDILDKQRI